ncbi:hypothetical protein AALO_G00046440 [Alosa alosa]|uniref:Immunoglobulin V-set domain-containing protein n=1 Tax=Alosa alosa TaxID=278164 RepID=A0AAV6H9D2_9TELE|nr:uncharacterized protein LOC125291977 [Alosa alosa]KAG5283813.1 hypothetical protein AALO_G00046440 [Alosa alosa]
MALPSKTTTCFLQILVFAVPLSMASQINATVGQSVLLPCFIPPPAVPLKDTRVYWQTVEVSVDDNPLLLHFINKGVEEPQHQALQYQNRTALDLSQVAKGNLSLELKNVTEADNQTTICCLYSTTKEPTPTELSCITLMVLPITDAAPDPQSFPGWATGLLIGALLLVVLLACGAVIFYKVHQRRTGQWDSTDAGANQDEEAGELENLTANGTANSTENGTANSMENSTENSTANGTANSTANSMENSTANGTANSMENSTANGTANSMENGTENGTANGKQP